MSYCVNCGVELAPSEKKCPLCNVRVINPVSDKTDEVSHPYPNEFEKPEGHLDRKYLAALVGLLLLIPIAVCMFVDYFYSNGISWSLFVAAAIVFVYVSVFAPLLFKSSRAVLSIVTDCVAALIFLKIIERFTGGSWFPTFALPLTLTVTALAVLLAAFVLTKPRIGFLLKFGCIIVSAGLTCVAIEIFLNMQPSSARFDGWSICAAIPCLLLGAVAILLSSNKKFTEQLRRKFFI